MIQRPTIVTALFDIGRDKWKSFNVSYFTYLSWMINTLSLKCNKVFYTEKKFYNEILKIVKLFDPDLTQTKIIQMSIESLSCFIKYNNRLESLLYSIEFKNKMLFDVPEMTQPLYNVVMFNKLDFIKDSLEQKYFETDLFIWMDAGGIRDNTINYRNSVWPDLERLNFFTNSKKVTFFSHKKDFDIKNNEHHSLSQVRYIQGGSIFCPQNTINDLHKSFNETIVESINNGYIGSDEKMLEITYQKNKTNYNIITCDWRIYYDMFK